MAGTGVAAFKAAGLPAVDMSKFKVAAKVAAQAAKTVASGPLLLRLLKDGFWVYGPDDVEVQEGSQWIIHSYSLAMGFAAWGEEKTPLEGQLVGERMALITDVPIDPASLPEHTNAPWRAQVQFDALCLTGEDAGTLVRYKTTSVGGRRAFAGLVQEVSNQSDVGDEIFPIVSLEAESYQHKKYGRTYVPLFSIVGWRTPDDTSGVDDDDAGDDAEVEGSTETRHTQEQEQEPKQETARRRRPAAAASSQPAREPEPEQPAARGRRPAAAVTEPQPEPVERGAVVRRRRR